MLGHDRTSNNSDENISLDDRIDVPQGVYNNETQGLVYPAPQAQGYDAPSIGVKNGALQDIQILPSFYDNSELRMLRARRKAIR